MWSRSLAAALVVVAVACSDVSRFPAPDGGLPNGAGGRAGGTGGSGPIDVVAGPLISESPAANWEAETHLAVAPDGRVFAVWIATQLGPRRFVGHAVSSDGGHTWSEAQLVPSDPLAEAVDPAVTVDESGVFHLVWLELPMGGGQRRVMTAAYLDGGGSFTIPTEVSDPQMSAVWDKPWIVGLGGDKLLIAWGTETGTSLFLARSADGETWQRSTFTPDGALRNVAFPCAAGGDRVYLSYLVPGGVELARSDDAGATWSKPTRVHADGESPAFEAPSCAAAGDDVWVLYGLSPESVDASHTPLLDEIRVARSHDGGASIVDRRTLGAGVRSLLPAIARAPGGRLDVVFYAGEGAFDAHAGLWWTRSSDGLAWSMPTALHAPLTLETARGGFGWLGDYIGVQSADDAVYVTFADNAAGPGLLSHVRFGGAEVP